jgi:hypothetical protein
MFTGTWDTVNTAPPLGLREDLSDIIYNISPTETPFMMMIGRGTAKSVLHEWQIDSLTAADTDNSHIEGDDVTFTEPAASIRVNNRAQISRKSVAISGTLETVDKAGRKSEMAYQLAKKAKELKRDMESILIAGRTGATKAPQAKAVRVTDQDGYLAPYETWMTVGDPGVQTQPQSRATVGTAGVGTATADKFMPTDAAQPVDGTLRAFKEADLKEVIRECWTEGGDPSVIMVGPFNKQALSAFSGNTTRFDRSEDMRLVTAVDIYVSDYGEHRVVPNRFSRDRSALVITPRMWSVDYLRGFRQFALAKTGDAEKRALVVEYTLRASNPHASGIVADLTIS